MYDQGVLLACCLHYRFHSSLRWYAAVLVRRMSWRMNGTHCRQMWRQRQHRHCLAHPLQPAQPQTLVQLEVSASCCARRGVHRVLLLTLVTAWRRVGVATAAAFRTAVADMPTAPSTPVATGGATAAELAELEQLQAMMA